MRYNLTINPPKCYWPKSKRVSQNGQTPNIIGICSYCVLDRPVFEWSQILLHPELTLWWSFLFADGAHHKKPHSLAHPTVCPKSPLTTGIGTCRLGYSTPLQRSHARRGTTKDMKRIGGTVVIGQRQRCEKNGQTREKNGKSWMKNRERGKSVMGNCNLN